MGPSLELEVKGLRSLGQEDVCEHVQAFRVSNSHWGWKRMGVFALNSRLRMSCQDPAVRLPSRKLKIHGNSPGRASKTPFGVLMWSAFEARTIQMFRKHLSSIESAVETVATRALDSE